MPYSGNTAYLPDQGGPSCPAGLHQSVRSTVARYRHQSTYLVQILREIQQEFGYIPEEAVDLVAGMLGIPRVIAAGVRGFYTFFHSAPRGEYEFLFSDNITDRMLGKEDLLQRLCNRLWLEPGRVSEDGLVSAGSTSCIGMSDQGPAALLNGLPLTRLTRERIDLICEWVRGRKPISEWPREFFAVTDNLWRKDILLEGEFSPGSAIRAAMEQGPDGAWAQIDRSGLRGRGGAGFKTAAKWNLCRNAQGGERYVVCNADEGEPGTFKDRVLLQQYADLVFEGMTVCAAVIGARKGFLYLRGEYRYLLDHLAAVLERRRRENLLGDRILGHPEFRFDIEIHLGAGAYICGEESALIESLEGRRGVPRKRPPFPVTRGYRGEPTVVNNVETFACAAKIVLHGGEWFAARGTEKSPGTKLLSISGDCRWPGVYEFPFGVPVREVIGACGAGNVRAVQVGGPSGTTIGEAEFDRRIAFEDLATGGSVMIFDYSRDLFEVAHNFAAFFAHESCGFCTPCRVGTTLMKNIMDKIASKHGTASDLAELESLGRLTRTTSHCGLGQTAANPIVDTIRKFRGDYDKRLKTQAFEPAFDLDRALETARKITGRDDEWAHL